jgi:hypothetical protein
VDLFVGCRQGTHFQSINDPKMYNLFNRRSGPISAAIAVTICDHVPLYGASSGPQSASSMAMVPPSPTEHLKDRYMKRYEPRIPRAALGLTAVAMATITLGALAVLPAIFDSVSANPYVAAAEAATKVPIGVVISPTRIDVWAEAGRVGHAHAGRTTLEAQEIGGKRHHSSSRSRNNT